MSFKKLACSLWACWAILSLSHGYAQDITMGLLNRYTFANGSLADSQSNNNLYQASNTSITPSFDRCAAANNAVKMHPKGYLAGANYKGILPTKRFTYCAWVRPTEARSGVVFSSGLFPYPDQWVTIGVSPNLTQAGFNIVVRQDNSNNPRAEANTPFFPLTPGDEWLFVCLVQDAGRFYFYVNGKKVCDVASPLPRFTPLNSWGQYELCFGGANGASADSQLGFPGLMDDIRVYNRALTDCEIGTLYRQNPATQTQPLAPLSISRSAKNCPVYTYSTQRALGTCYAPANDSYLEWTLPNGTKVIGDKVDIHTIDLAGQTLKVEEKYPNRAAPSCPLNSANVAISPAMATPISPANIVQTSNAPLSVALTTPNFAGTGAITWKLLSQSTGGFSLSANGNLTNAAPLPGISTVSVIAIQNGVESCPQNITVNIPCLAQVQIVAYDFAKVCNSPSSQLVKIEGVPTALAVTWAAYFTDLNGVQYPQAVVVEGNDRTAMLSFTSDIKTSGTITVIAHVNGCVYTKVLPLTYSLPTIIDPGFIICSYQMQNIAGFFFVNSVVESIEFVSESPEMTIAGTVTNGTEQNGLTKRHYNLDILANTAGMLPFRMKCKDVCGITTMSPLMYIFASGDCSGYNEWLNRAGKADTGETSLQIAPNPVAQQITLAGNLESEYAMQLLDAQGKQLAQFAGKLKSIEGALQAQIGKLKAGVYFLRAQTPDGKMEVKKFVKAD